jgi:hypothetical protein
VSLLLQTSKDGNSLSTFCPRLIPLEERASAISPKYAWFFQTDYSSETLSCTAARTCYPHGTRPALTDSIVIGSSLLRIDTGCLAVHQLVCDRAFEHVRPSKDKTGNAGSPMVVVAYGHHEGFLGHTVLRPAPIDRLPPYPQGETPKTSEGCGNRVDVYSCPVQQRMSLSPGLESSSPNFVRSQNNARFVFDLPSKKV